MSREDVQSHALDIVRQHNRCGLGISMGVGKTRIAIKHLQDNYDNDIKVLVVIPKLSVKKAWLEELDKMGLNHFEENITFSTYLSIHKHNPMAYQLVYLDECHSLLESHEAFLNAYSGKILGLTGTPPVRRGTEKYRMVNKYCPIVYEFSVDEATDSKILNDYQIIVHELDLDTSKSLQKKRKDGGVWYTSEAKDYEYISRKLADAGTMKQKSFLGIMRMRSLMDYTTKEKYVKSIILPYLGSKCLVFANTQKQADRICKHSYHSGNPASEHNLELFNDGRIDKLSCVMQLSEGVTISNLKQGIIMHAYNNERKTAQRIGRLLRLSPNEKAICHILAYKNTVDASWVGNALQSFDESKIKYYNPLENG